MIVHKFIRNNVISHHLVSRRLFCSRTSCDESFIRKLKDIVGEDNVSNTQAVREQHGKDESFSRSYPPEVVVFPASTKHVSDLMKTCYQSRVPMIPFGTGTGLEAGVTALQGGVCFDLMKMNKIKSVYEEDFMCTIEPGVTKNTLNSHLRDTGLWFPVDPGADASLCGMAATSASGTNAVRYGTMKDNVINLEVVLADGTIFHTQGANRRSKKTAAGYNITNLFVGSEGTLGIITEATLKLYGVPEATMAAVCQFNSMQEAIDTTVQCLQNSIPVARIEFLDDIMMEMSINYSKLEGFQKLHSLFVEFHGSENTIQDQVELFKDIALSNNGSSFYWAKDQDKRNVLWKARHNAWYAVLASRPGSKAKATDVCVPISRLPEAIKRTQDLLKNSFLTGPIAGHVGDGNFHVAFAFDPNSEKEVEEQHNLTESIGEIALDLDGTCTGEHGIGCGKRELLLKEMGPDCINVMRTIKRSLDPYNLMNPGKVFLE